MTDRLAASPDLTLGQVLGEYLVTLKPETRRTHELYVRKYVEYIGEGFLLSALSGARVESYAEAQIRPSDPAAPERVMALKAWFQFLKKREYVTSNFGVNVRARKVATRASAGRAQRIDETPLEMTAEGIVTLERDLAELEIQRADLIHAIELARSDGDLRENAPYHAAREALAFADQRRRQLSNSLRRAVVAEHVDDGRSGVGSTVNVTNLDDDRKFDYKLVSAREANAAERKISVDSPVGRQLLGRRAGDEVAVATPRGEVRFRVEAVVD